MKTKTSRAYGAGVMLWDGSMIDCEASRLSFEFEFCFGSFREGQERLKVARLSVMREVQHGCLDWLLLTLPLQESHKKLKSSSSHLAPSSPFSSQH